MEDQIVRENHFERDMSITLKDGTVIPVKGHVIEAIHASGKKDVRVEVDRPLQLKSDNPLPGIDQ